MLTKLGVSTDIAMFRTECLLKDLKILIKIIC
jgi:hypothetical protein